MKPRIPLLTLGTKIKPSSKIGQMGFSRIAIASSTIVLLSLLLSIQMLPNKVTLKVGDIATEDIIAQRTVRYIDTTQTELRRAQAAASAGAVYDPVPDATDQAIAALRSIIRIIIATKQVNGFEYNAQAISSLQERISPLTSIPISNSAITSLLKSNSTDLQNIEAKTTQVITTVMSREIKEDPSALRIARKYATSEAEKIASDPIHRDVIAELARCVIRPNQVYNEQKTRARQERARREVQPSYAIVVRGEKVIRKGEKVLPEHIDKFEALGLRAPKLHPLPIIGVTLLVIICVVLVATHLRRFHPEVYNSPKALLLLSILILVSTFALRVGGSLLGIQFNPSQVGYIGTLWIVTAAMFTAVLVDRQVAVLVTALLSIIFAIVLSNDLRYACEAMITGLVAIYCVADIKGRQDLLRTLGYLAGVGALLVWVCGAITGEPAMEMLSGTFWAGLVVPLVATTLFFFGTVPLERPFERVTHLSLLELADTNNPLLRKLLMEAPGTYTHSMAVGHLAESAAAAIGADTLIARIASYYHDIGKLRRPHFFIENQHVENVHDTINPTLSTIVITSHVRDGIEIGKEYRLPKVVLDVIAQHHGSSLVQFFYNQFTDAPDPSTPVEQRFRYPGPKPKTKEAAIVMLADSVEAASRTLVKPSPAKIETLVNRVVAEKLRDGQLDESDLTFREVSMITSCFARTLTGTMHARIEYPEPAQIQTNERKGSTNADSDTQRTISKGEQPSSAEHSSASSTS
ncbi:MAG: HD family phosphohydrolase [Armatimonadota bacterium]